MATSYKAAAIAYAAALLGFTGFLMLDTFVRSSAKQTGATEINYALFADETKETAAQTAEQSSAGTDASGTAGSTASSAQTGSQTAAETAGTTGAETKKRSAQTQQAYTDPLSEAYAAEESPAGSADTSATASETAAPETETVTEPPVEFVNSDTVYQDENIRIAISEYTENDTAVYVADVQLSSAEYLKTAFANDTFGKNVTRDGQGEYRLSLHHGGRQLLHHDRRGIYRTGASGYGHMAVLHVRAAPDRKRHCQCR